MAISFPTGLDNFTNPSSGNTLDSPSHSLQHSDLNDAVEALETKLGVGASPAGSASAGQVLTISAAGTSTWSAVPNTSGLIQIVPASVAVGSGSSSVDSNGRVTFTSVSSVSLNDVFSTTYKNYHLMLNLTCASGAEVRMRLRVSGADDSTSAYTTAVYYLRSNTSLFSGTGYNGTTTSYALSIDGNTTNLEANVNLYEPFETSVTRYINTGVYSGYSPRQDYADFAGAVFDATTSFTGFTIFPSTSSITGTISVYGYK